ncbi:MAG: phenylalanine--tRNA ligase subunit beta [Kiritimatiellaeota bacterium]|nr:phenylalanine--tRNA ligase subunit beta [Kiritimatiellota bacterium]
MKTSVQWLKEYTDIPWPPDELAERLTLAGLEVEGVEQFGRPPAGVVVGEILERRPHPSADRLSICRVDVGAGDPVQVVCGAPNCDAGVKAPFAPVGVRFSDGTRIKKAKLRGVVSFGMLCSARELGLGADHTGILHLAAEHEPGTPLARLFPGDTVIDWEVTPNRPDWLSHVGIAREIAAVADAPESFQLPGLPAAATCDQAAADLTAVDIQAPDLCPRYIARVIRNVTVGPSPEWMQKRLEAVGVRPINNVVDVTNYVLMECGQPLHAFDWELLGEHRIVVRRARPGEHLTTLDGNEHELTDADLLIADADKGVALAGVMGGENSEISESTRTVLLESAAFLPRSIRATAKRHGLSTEASHRFERGVGLDMVEFASGRAATLIAELGGGEVLDGAVDAFPGQPGPRLVTCRFARVNRLLGTDLSADRITRCFVRLGLPIHEQNAEAVTIRTPSFRLDLEREADLIEEVARMHGLENISAKAAPAVVGGPRSADAYYPLEQARTELRGLGLDEIMNYSLLSVAEATRGTGVVEDELIHLANPLSAELACLRPSLLPGLLETVARNAARQEPNLALFELGRVAVQRPGTPEERYQVGIGLTGRPHPERYGEERTRTYDFYDLKGLIESWLEQRRIAGLLCRVARHPAFASTECAEFATGSGQTLAVLGRVAPEFTADMRLTSPLYVALVEMSALFEIAAPPLRYVPLPQFPATVRDISMLAPTELTHGEIDATLRELAPEWLEHIELFDVFEDAAALGEGRKSLAYSLTYRSLKRTLTDEQVNRAHEKLKAALAARLPVQFR